MSVTTTAARTGPVPELEEYLRQVEAQKTEAAELVRGLGPDQFLWRPRPEKWSIGEHLAHLPRATRPYLEAIEAAVGKARDGGLLSDGPYRFSWFGSWFIRSMEPPPRMRIRTMKSLEPVVAHDPAAVLQEFLAVQDDVAAAIRAADGVDLVKARIRSPFFKPIRLGVGQAFGVLLAHNRRHFWHMRQVLEDPRLP